MPLDLDILYFFNRTIAGPSFDPIVVALTTFKTWIPVYVIAAGLLIYYKRWLGVRIIISTMLLAGVLDLSTNRILKPVVARERPCNVQPSIEWLRLPNGTRSGFSFPSSHAVNNFGAAVFLIVLFSNRKWVYSLLLVAAIVAATRMYLGLHYPSDTIGGAILGAFIGFWWAKLYSWFENRFFETSSTPKTL
ncbi:MAG TPA: phosphatase PAP2 family protein [Candidatus Kapabacteria bacterium]|nr:phosphatase PAP2 family protein [Candidatus Kapabacteria bacterium]